MVSTERRYAYVTPRALHPKSILRVGSENESWMKNGGGLREGEEERGGKGRGGYERRFLRLGCVTLVLGFIYEVIVQAFPRVPGP